MQLIAPKDGEIDTNLVIAGMVADALNELGQVKPILYDPSDPAIRAAVARGNIDPLQVPTDAQIQKIAGGLGVDYTLILACQKHEGEAMPLARLFRGSQGRPIWSYGFGEDNKNRPMIYTDGKVNKEQTEQIKGAIGDFKEIGSALTVMSDGVPDWESTGLTIARTIASLLRQSAFKHLPVRPNIKIPMVNGDLRIDGDNGALIAPPGLQAVQIVQSLRSEGNIDKAIIILRDAIDQNPKDASLRVLLAELLSSEKLHAESAAVWDSVAHITGKPAEAWLEAAKEWGLAKEPIRAQNAVHQALARGLVNPLALSILSESMAARGEFNEALEAVSKSIDSGPTPRAIIVKATLHAMLGQKEKAKSELTPLSGSNPEGMEMAYDISMSIVDTQLDTLLKTFQSVPRILADNQYEPEYLAQLTEQIKQLEAITTLYKSLPVPSRFLRSHKARIVAQELMLKACQEMLEFVTTRDRFTREASEKHLEEAAILLPGIRSSYEQEKLGQLSV